MSHESVQSYKQATVTSTQRCVGGAGGKGAGAASPPCPCGYAAHCGHGLQGAAGLSGPHWAIADCSSRPNPVAKRAATRSLIIKYEAYSALRISEIQTSVFRTLGPDDRAMARKPKTLLTINIITSEALTLPKRISVPSLFTIDPPYRSIVK
jgi:hypothetical protein